MRIFIFKRTAARFYADLPFCQARNSNKMPFIHIDKNNCRCRKEISFIMLDKVENNIKHCIHIKICIAYFLGKLRANNDSTAKALVAHTVSTKLSTDFVGNSKTPCFIGKFVKK